VIGRWSGDQHQLQELNQWNKLVIMKKGEALNQHENLIKSLNWFLSFITRNEWMRRREIIEKKLSERVLPTKPLAEGARLVIKEDLIGWYLYLVDVMIHEPHKYEYFQGARVLPIFYRFGLDLDLLKNIGGIDQKVKELLRRRQSEADAFLFEFLTALLWVRNGYEVSFIQEENKSKTPDLEARKDGNIWNIECKRQSKTADYTNRESAKREKMISHIGEILGKNDLLIDVTFHVELESLPDTFLRDLIVNKLPITVPGKIVSDKNVDIEISFIDISSINKYLKDKDVKYYSPEFNSLIGQKPVDGRAFTFGADVAKFFKKGEGGNNLFVDEIRNAFGIYWSCDAEAAIWAKARDVRSQVYSAVQQFNSANTAVIHIGIETFDGPQVEKARIEKIRDTFQKLDPKEKKLQWVFIHYLQSYSPPNQDWVFDETVSAIVASSTSFSPNSPLLSRLMIVPEDGDNASDIYHWDRPLP
jgi:hypothetical protein